MSMSLSAIFPGRLATFVMAALATALLAANPARGDPSVTIHAHIDGRDQLILQGDHLRWHHFAAAAVGRHAGSNSPTIVEVGGMWDTLAELFPIWPEPWPSEIYDLEAYSETMTLDFPMVAAQAVRWHLTKLSARGNVRIVAQPSAANQYRLVVEFDDLPYGGSTFYSIRLSPATQVVIDLRPWSRSNIATPGSDDSVHVAVLSDLMPKGFDATSIEPGSVRFGRNHASPTQFVHTDVNGDRRQDLVVTFIVSETGLACGDAEVGLIARTSSGVEIEGRDVVRTVGCR